MLPSQQTEGLWISAQTDWNGLSFCLFTELEEQVRQELGQELAASVCLFSKPSNPAD